MPGRAFIDGLFGCFVSQHTFELVEGRLSWSAAPVSGYETSLN
jgi:hypothetical protein